MESAASVDPETARPSDFSAAWIGAPATSEALFALDLDGVSFRVAEDVEAEVEAEADVEADATWTKSKHKHETRSAPTHTTRKSKAVIRGKDKGTRGDKEATASAQSVHGGPRISDTGRGCAVLPGAPNPAGLPVLEAVVWAYRLSSLAAGSGTSQSTSPATSQGKSQGKVKPACMTKQACLLNFVAAANAFAERYPGLPVRVILVKDQCHRDLARFADHAFDAVMRVAQPLLVFEQHETRFGSGARSFCFVLDALRALPPALCARADRVGVYLVEDDYFHVPHALSAILDGLALAPLSSGYDHPDKYAAPAQGGNPLVQYGGEVSRVLLGARCHFKTTNSTTMTFCATLQTLFEDDAVLREACETDPADDFHLFLTLFAARGRTLVTPLPAVSTHGETALLAPFFPTEKLGAHARAFLEALA